MMKKIVGLLILSVCLLISTAGAESINLDALKKLEQIVPNFAKVENGIYRGAQPPDEAYKYFNDAGFKTIVNLRNNKKYVNMEVNALKKGGYNIEIVRIPSNSLRYPTKEELEKFFSVLKDKSKKPIFVHCKQGSDRTGILFGCYRIKYYRWSPEKTLEEMLKYNFNEFWFGHLKVFLYKYAQEFNPDIIYKTNPFDTIKITIFRFFYFLVHKAYKT